MGRAPEEGQSRLGRFCASHPTALCPESGKNSKLIPHRRRAVLYGRTVRRVRCDLSLAKLVADLKLQRARIDRAVAVLERIRAGRGTCPTPEGSQAPEASQRERPGGCAPQEPAQAGCRDPVHRPLSAGRPLRVAGQQPIDETNLVSEHQAKGQADKPGGDT
jgi:hypothetical protein